MNEELMGHSKRSDKVGIRIKIAILPSVSYLKNITQ
jgi:hypothetical protein